ncbi:hypothetical protein ElyMa_004116400 [Elysia marginata]|uniref:H15 domain-containing protein n=1 Tax=Elysia marginata TaxID=1093978 RepID=A0AAV4GD69_9GAST|nr:hypothetical protein ElyMa_004116400 [Elysia marginata]
MVQLLSRRSKARSLRKHSMHRAANTKSTSETRRSKSFSIQPPSEAKKLFPTSVSSENCNTNNQDADADETTGSLEQRKPELPLAILVRLIVLALQKISDPRGSSLKDIRRFLATAGVIEETTDLRHAMIVALKLGAVARPVWAVRAGLYGRYVQGDGIPIFAGRKSRPKHARHRSSHWVRSSGKCKKNPSKKTLNRKGKRRRNKSSRS